VQSTTRPIPNTLDEAPTAAPRVAFQGEQGAYSDEAIALHWGGAASAVPARECADVAAAVERGAVDFGLLPIENTLAGSVVATYDALAGAPQTTVVAEVVLPIHHCVLALPGASLASLTTVESHPIALAQCRDFLAGHRHIEARPAYDTAGAARAVAERGDPRVAAIASRAAAQRFGLRILLADVEDRPDNQTRFLVIAREPAPLPPRTPSRSVILADIDNAPGALLRLLAPIATAGLNMSKLESRPAGTPWSYRFFLEVEHESADTRLDGVVAALREEAQHVRVLGTYAAASVRRPTMTTTPMESADE
jgi:prephenate dehydratase